MRCGILNVIIIGVDGNHGNSAIINGIANLEWNPVSIILSRVADNEKEVLGFLDVCSG